MDEFKGDSKTLSIVAFICGLVGIILTFTPASVVGLILAILAIVFACMAKKREAPSGLRTAGFVLGIIAVVLWIIVIVVVGALLGTACAALGAAAATGLY